jgi:hypothetical protein
MIVQTKLALALVFGAANLAPAASVTLDAIQNGNINYTYTSIPISYSPGSYSNVTASTIAASSTYVSMSMGSITQDYSDADFLFHLSSGLPAGATITQAILTVTNTATTGQTGWTSYGFPDTTGDMNNDASSVPPIAFPGTGGLAVTTGANSFDVTSYFTGHPGSSAATYVGFGLTGPTFGVNDNYSATFDSMSATSGVPTLTLTYTTAAVPEPASVAMLGTGLASLGLLARRRRCATRA